MGVRRSMEGTWMGNGGATDGCWWVRMGANGWVDGWEVGHCARVIAWVRVPYP